MTHNQIHQENRKMFTGIVEEVGIIQKASRANDNLHIWVKSNFINELKIDQSISHNGVCLTVSGIEGDLYEVIAVKETLTKSNLGSLKAGDAINLERCMKLNDRLDGHIVQGHVDTTAIVHSIKENKGSKNFSFKLPKDEKLIVEKGSVCVNGTSLTTFNVDDLYFSVTIIPYTLENTSFQFLQEGDAVNIEFDIIGKYISRLVSKNL